MPSWDVRFDLRVDASSPRVVTAVARAEALAQVIRGIPIPPGLRKKLDSLNILRAVRGTTGIEGIELTEEEVAKIIGAPQQKRVLPPNRGREEQEARNAQYVMKFVAALVDRFPDYPLTERLICRIHKLTTEGIEYNSNVPGSYRNHPTIAGDYVPPRTGEEVRFLMKEFVRWFNEECPVQWAAPLRAVVAHFYLVSIHPFADGNGRTARGVESFLLYQGGINALGFYSLSNFYYRRRDEYMGKLTEARFRTHSDLTPFLLFALEGLVNELQTVHQEVLSEVQVIAFRDYARESLVMSGKIGTKPGERVLRLLIALTLQSETISIADLRHGRHPVARHYKGLGSKTLSRDLNTLRDLGLVRVEGDRLVPNIEIMDYFAAKHIRRQRL